MITRTPPTAPKLPTKRYTVHTLCPTGVILTEVGSQDLVFRKFKDMPTLFSESPENLKAAWIQYWTNYHEEF